MSRNIKYNCGQIIPSGCVLYTGDIPAFINATDLACDPNVDEILAQYGAQIQLLLTGNTLTGLNPKSLVFNPATITVSGLHQVEINAIDSLSTLLTALQTQVNNLNIATMNVVIDLKCLTPAANPNNLPVNTYTLSTILGILVDQICTIKINLGI